VSPGIHNHHREYGFRGLRQEAHPGNDDGYAGNDGLPGQARQMTRSNPGPILQTIFHSSAVLSPGCTDSLEYFTSAHVDQSLVGP